MNVPTIKEYDKTHFKKKLSEIGKSHTHTEAFLRELKSLVNDIPLLYKYLTVIAIELIFLPPLKCNTSTKETHCPICLEDGNRKIKLDCGHFIDKKCYREYYNSLKKSTMDIMNNIQEDIQTTIREMTTYPYQINEKIILSKKTDVELNEKIQGLFERMIGEYTHLKCPLCRASIHKILSYRTKNVFIET